MKTRTGNALATFCAAVGCVILLGAASDNCGGDDPVKKTEKQCSKKYHTHCKIYIHPSPKHPHGGEVTHPSAIPAHDHPVRHHHHGS